MNQKEILYIFFDNCLTVYPAPFTTLLHKRG